MLNEKLINVKLSEKEPDSIMAQFSRNKDFQKKESKTSNDSKNPANYRPKSVTSWPVS